MHGVQRAGRKEEERFYQSGVAPAVHGYVAGLLFASGWTTAKAIVFVRGLYLCLELSDAIVASHWGAIDAHSKSRARWKAAWPNALRSESLESIR